MDEKIFNINVYSSSLDLISSTVSESEKYSDWNIDLAIDTDSSEQEAVEEITFESILETLRQKIENSNLNIDDENIINIFKLIKDYITNEKYIELGIKQNENEVDTLSKELNNSIDEFQKKADELNKYTSLILDQIGDIDFFQPSPSEKGFNNNIVKTSINIYGKYQNNIESIKVQYGKTDNKSQFSALEWILGRGSDTIQKSINTWFANIPVNNDQQYVFYQYIVNYKNDENEIKTKTSNIYKIENTTYVEKPIEFYSQELIDDVDVNNNIELELKLKGSKINDVEKVILAYEFNDNILTTQKELTLNDNQYEIDTLNLDYTIENVNSKSFYKLYYKYLVFVSNIDEPYESPLYEYTNKEYI